MTSAKIDPVLLHAARDIALRHNIHIPKRQMASLVADLRDLLADGRPPRTWMLTCEQLAAVFGVPTIYIAEMLDRDDAPEHVLEWSTAPRASDARLWLAGDVYDFVDALSKNA